MTAGAHAIRLEETLLDPAALPPPPTRHVLFVLVIALAALLHLGTVGIGDLYSETEGQYAGAAREMFQAGEWLLPTNDSIPRLQKPPLLYWLILASYKIFGVSAAAARVPIALSVIATAALTFALGERLFDYWRGFSAALIYLTCSGTFIFSRIVMPEPVFAALIAGAIYCGLAGFQERKRRRAWFAGFWICAGLACLAKGPHGLLFPAGIFVVLSIFYRQARQRFKALLWWPNLLLFLALIGPWNLWADLHFHGSFHRVIAAEWSKHLVGRYPNGTWYDDVPRLQFAGMHLAWWFPWSLAILSPLVFSWRRVVRPSEITLTDALPIVWLAVVLIPVLIIGQRQDYYALPAFGAFALWTAMILERSTRAVFARGAILLSFLGLAAIALAIALPYLVSGLSQNWGETENRWTAALALRNMPAASWLQFRWLIAVAGSALILGAMISLLLLRKGYGKIAAVGFAVGMIPIGFSIIHGMAQIAPYFSLAGAARFLNPRLGKTAEIIFEGSPGVASSLGFYLEGNFALVNQAPEPNLPLTPAQRRLFLAESDALNRWGAPRAVFLIVEQDRLAHWRRLLTERFHVYHQVATCGTYVVLSNQF